jgi:hypothetical protein
MKKIVPLVLMIILFACRESQDVKPISQTDEIYVTDGRLTFRDLEHFRETFVLIQQGTLYTDEGRLPDLNYTSFYSTVKDPTKVSESNLEVLDLYEYRVLLNQNREVLIGRNIYSVSNDETLIYDLNEELTEVVKNEASFYDKKAKKFKTPNKYLNGKVFGENDIQVLPIGVGVFHYAISYRWLRFRSIIITYYYDADFLNLWQPTNAEHFERNISDCEASSCLFPVSNPYGGFAYNTSHIRYPCGGNTRSHELANGAWLRAVYWVKAYGFSPISIQHIDYLEIP